MRLLVTSDIHYNHARSRGPADELIARMNRAGGDVLLVIGDTAVVDGDALEQCLSRFCFAGPKLFVAGNHELWTAGPDSYQIFAQQLPDRVRALGWTWLEDDPFVASDRSVAIVGSVGWYDYSFAVPELQIPDRFYEHKVSPGAATRLPEFEHLLRDRSDLSRHATEVVARWNDGKFVKLHRTDAQFLDERLANFATRLNALRDVPHVIAAVHHVPFAQLLPPRRGAQWDFARAYLGSAKIGALLAQHTNVQDVMCGHSHFPAEARIGAIRAVNIGSGYRVKYFRAIELSDT
jgi:predicted phosphodiesterase